MKSYLITTGIIFALFSIGHVVELVSHWSSPESDPWFTVSVAAIVLASGALSLWAFRLLRRVREG